MAFGAQKTLCQCVERAEERHAHKEQKVNVPSYACRECIEGYIRSGRLIKRHHAHWQETGSEVEALHATERYDCKFFSLLLSSQLTRHEHHCVDIVAHVLEHFLEVGVIEWQKRDVDASIEDRRQVEVHLR